MSEASPPEDLRVGLVTMCASRSVDDNVATAARLIREAAGEGATYIQTPEFTSLMEMRSADLFAASKPEEDDKALAAFRTLARDLGVTLHVGSISVLVKPGKLANRSFVIAPTGDVVGRYDKIHMFDAALGGGENFRESKNYEPGAEAVVVDLPWGALGLSVCYDLRFPHLYRALAQAGARAIAVPSAFARQTGEVHWHPLLKARAIETEAFILASAQAGRHECGRETFGRSLIVSPWGEVIAEGGVHPSVTVADVQLRRVAEARRSIPSLEHDRPFNLVRVGYPARRSAS